ncbi:MAG: HDOD domain-containing protein [Rhodopirellula sp.]|nr:HDOD domain-containing protein [Rhodopirellula sp.]
MSKNGFPQVDLKRLLTTEQLPAMPQSALRLLELSRDPGTGPREFAIPIESDPGLTMQVLRFVNSSYFGFRNEISNVRQAITLVGMRTIKNFTLWSAVFSLIPNPKCGCFDLKSLWQDSLRRAIFARRMATLLGVQESEEAFAAALLQDMAVPLLAKEVPDAYSTLFGARSNSDSRIRLSMLEQHVFGWTHAEAAGIMARRWHLPEVFATLIEEHLAVDKWVSQAHAEPAKLAVAMSALLPTAEDSGWVECGAFEDYYRKVAPDDAPGVSEILGDVDQEFSEFGPILKLASPGRSLVQRYESVFALTSANE